MIGKDRAAAGGCGEEMQGRSGGAEGNGEDVPSAASDPVGGG